MGNRKFKNFSNTKLRKCPHLKALCPPDPTPLITSCTELKKKKNWTPIFFIGGPPYTTPPPPPLPLALSFFYPHFFIGPPPPPPPLPLAEYFFLIFFLPPFFYRGPPYTPPPLPPPLPLAQSIFFIFYFLRPSWIFMWMMEQYSRHYSVLDEYHIVHCAIKFHYVPLQYCTVL